MTTVDPSGVPARKNLAWRRLALPAFSIRQMLALVVLSTAVPLLALCLAMFGQTAAVEREATRSAMLASALTLAALADNEIASHIALAAGLASSPSLDSGDLAAFRTQALQALEVLPGAWISLSDTSGHFVASTLLDPGSPLPPRGKLDVMEKAWSTGQPQVSDVVNGPVSKRQNAYIEVPVHRSGKPLYSIVIGLDPDRFQALLRGKFGDKGAVAIIDRQRRFVARIPDNGSRLGTPAAAEWRAAIDRAPTGLAETTTLEGKLSLTAYAQTKWGWTVGLSEPLDVLDAPGRRIFWTVGLLGVFFAVAGLGLGLALARRIGVTMEDLAHAAAQVGCGQIVAPRPTAVREATVVRAALSASSRELARQKQALEVANATFRSLVENSPFGVYIVDADFRLVLVAAGARKVFKHVHPLVGRDFAEVLRLVWKEPFASTAIDHFRHALATGQSYHAPNASAPRKESGLVESYDWEVERIIMPDGRAGVVCHFYDLSERERSARVLRESEERFRTTFENSAVGVAHLAPDGKWLRVNAKLCEITGYSEDELKASTFQEITHPDDLATDLEHARALLAGEIQSYSMDKRYVRKGKTLIWIGLTVSLQRGDDGAPDYFISIVRDIGTRKQTQAHLDFLLEEMAHRSKNQLTIIQAIARQTARNAASLGDFREQFGHRLQGLAISTDLLVGQNWNGAALRDLVHRQAKPFLPEDARMSMAGPDLSVNGDAAQTIGLALHELATNCLKYGAWSNANGAVDVKWRVDKAHDGVAWLHLRWREHGGPAVAPPDRKGFGHVVTDQMVSSKLDGKVELAFDPAGVVWTLSAPVARVEARLVAGLDMRHASELQSVPHDNARV